MCVYDDSHVIHIDGGVSAYCQTNMYTFLAPLVLCPSPSPSSAVSTTTFIPHLTYSHGRCLGRNTVDGHNQNENSFVTTRVPVHIPNVCVEQRRPSSSPSSSSSSSSPSPSPSPSPAPTIKAPKPKSPRKAPPKLDRIVCKFGGSSLADSTRLEQVTKLVHLQISASNRKPVIVLSAMGNTTNELLKAGQLALHEGIVDMSRIKEKVYKVCDDLGLNKEIIVDPLLMNLDQLLLGVKFIKELSLKTLDYLVSFGERLSVRIFAEHLKKNHKINAVPIDSFDMGFLTNDSFTKAELLKETYYNVQHFIKHSIDHHDIVAVVTGFIAKDLNGNITTLGRGGSDLTASVIGASIGASEVQVWKDVDGILSTDPRIVKNATPVPSVMFEEAAEMAYFGAKVLHPTAMQPAMKSNIPVRVKNSYNPSHPGTVIVRSRKRDSTRPVTAISLKKNVQLVDIVSTRMLGAYGFLAEVFKIFAIYKISIDVIATSEVSISVTLDESNCGEKTRGDLQTALEEIAKVQFVSGKAIVSLVSDYRKSSEVLGRAMKVLRMNDIGLHMISQGASKFNVSLIIDADLAKKAVALLHEEFFGQ